MTLVKNMLAGDENCSVIFTLSDSIMDHAKKVAVVGDFNDWDAKKNCMKKTKNGKFSCTVVLQRGRE
ncbi:MAG: glycoside hydrolase, partial [Bacteroidota bacterium]